MHSVFFRFYEELNDFLPPERRKIRFGHSYPGRTSVKDVIESLGVPHTEVDLILVNGNSVDFSYILNEGDDISVYPVFESFDIENVQHLRPVPLRKPKFIADVHLGSLARYMLMLGLDTLYKNNFMPEEIIIAALQEKRTILTKSREMLKNNQVTHGYYIRNNTLEEQLKEVISRFHLEKEILPFSRCLSCNIFLEQIDKEQIIDRIPQKVQEWQNEFYVCPKCGKIYWKGSHYTNMRLFIEKLFP